MRFSILCLAAVLCWALLAPPARAQSATPAFPANFKYPALARDATVLEGLGPDRSAGSAGAQQSADYLADALAQRTGQPVLRQRFTVTVPVVEFCQATDSAHPPHPFSLWPLSPAGAQPAALLGKETTADITYAGQGTLDELQGKPIRDHWVALSVESGRAWQTLGALGARGIIFLGGPDTVARDLLDKQTTVPIGLPRFYSDDASLRAALQNGALSRLTIRVSIRWQERPCENLLCLIPGRASSSPVPSAPTSPQNWTDQVIILQAPYDASSTVLGRSPGALSALNAAAVVDLAERVSHAPSHAAVLVLLTGGDEWLFHGTRAFLDLLDQREPYPAALQTLDQQNAALAQSLDDGRALLQRLAPVSTGDLSPLGKKATWSQRDPLVETVRDELDRRAVALEEQLRVARLEAAGASIPAALQARIARLNADKQARLDAAAALDRLRDLDTARETIQSAAADLLAPWRREVDRRAAAVDRHHDWPDIRHRIGSRPIMIDMAIALTDGAPQFGFFARSQAVALNDLAGRMAPFNKSFDRYLADAQQADPNYVSAYDPRTAQSAYPIESFLAAPRVFPTDIALLQGLPASAFATLGGADARLDTPNDTLARVRWPNLERQLMDVYRLLLGSSFPPARNAQPPPPGALTDPFFFSRTDFANVSAGQTIQLLERTLGQGSPHVGAAEHLVGVEQLVRGDGSPMPALLGMRPLDWALTPAGGSVQFTSLTGIDHRLHAFHFDDDGLIDRAASQPDAPRFNPDLNNPQSVIMFDCRRIDLFELFDPRYLEYLDHLELLDALRRDHLPDANTYLHAGLAAAFIPPATRWQLLVSKGDIGNRMVLLNADAQHPTGHGFAAPGAERAPLPPLAWQNARDLFTLDDQRKHDLESFGISNDVIRALHGAPPAKSPSPPAATAPFLSTYDHLQAGRAAEEALDYAAWLGHANAAQSMEITVYNNLIATSNGIIRGVIFLLAGLIPFSYFLERLVIGSTRVLRQIGGFAAIFAIMTAALWFHPAFRISAAPAMILLAFLILLLSSAVVWILWGKFEQEVTRLRGATAAVHISSFQRGAVLGSAIRLGLSNMRRRGARTGLTLATLILLTFTLLCFTSVREAVTLTPQHPPEAPLNAPPGILLHQFSWQPLLSPVNTLVRELTGQHGVASYRYAYASNMPDLPWQIPVQTADGRQDFLASGLVGLDPHENLFQSANMEQALPGWSALAGGARVCCLPAEARLSAPFKVGDTVRILGQSLRIAGFFTVDGVSQLQQLTGDSLMPLDPASTGGISLPSANSLPTTPTLNEPSYRFLSPRQAVIVPAAVARELGARLTSVMILPQDPARITPLAEDLARRSAFTVVASDGHQVRAYNAAAASSTENLDTVLVPMILAGIIVLSTMLGAVAERKREIHVYTSLGLAPIHIGTLFLAEAAALGTLGVVFGYIFGQGLATILSHFHLISGVELNYSSLPAMATMGLVLVIVMLSSLWPARLAARVATPSLQRDWKLPAAQGDVLLVELPFTVNQSAAQGVCAFLAEYFVSVSQAGTGHFTAENVRPFHHDRSRGIKAHVWLAPYDLGVLQTLWLAIHPTPDEHVYEVHLTLVREAGNAATWQRLNRPFLVEIRKQFLLWRAVAPNVMQQYVEQSETMFANAETEGPPGEETSEVRGVEVQT